MGWLGQSSLLMVVKEGLGLYKVISEGIINVSDKFFDMEYLDALKGLEIYKQAVLDFGNLQVCWPSIFHVWVITLTIASVALYCCWQFDLHWLWVCRDS